MFRLAQPRRYTRERKSAQILAAGNILYLQNKSLQICLLTLELPKTGIIGYWHAPCLHEYKGFCFAFLNQFFGSRIFSRCLFSLRGICQEYLTNSQKKARTNIISVTEEKRCQCEQLCCYFLISHKTKG